MLISQRRLLVLKYGFWVEAMLLYISNGIQNTIEKTKPEAEDVGWLDAAILKIQINLIMCLDSISRKSPLGSCLPSYIFKMLHSPTVV